MNTFRRTRFEWMDSVWWAKYASRPMDWVGRQLVGGPKRPKREKKKKLRWQYAVPLPGVSGTVFAHTRSEARSEIKKRHGIKGRVPIGAVITVAA